jgi:hypothetical protein
MHFAHRPLGTSEHTYKLRPSPLNHPLVKASMDRWAKGLPSPVPASMGVAPPAGADLSPFFAGIRNQGGEGACTGFATAQFREVQMAALEWKEGMVPVPLPLRLSPAYLYARTRMGEGTFPADSGATMADEFAVLQAYGVCPETDMPYDQDPAEPIPNIADAAAVEYRIGQPTMVDLDDPKNGMAVLNARLPIAIAIPVYDSFEGLGAGGVLPVPDPSKEALHGGHGVLLIGYDAGRQLYKGVNQWGTSWGAGGYFWMPMSGYPIWEAWTAPS